MVTISRQHPTYDASNIVSTKSSLYSNLEARFSCRTHVRLEDPSLGDFIPLSGSCRSDQIGNLSRPFFLPIVNWRQSNAVRRRLRLPISIRVDNDPITLSIIRSTEGGEILSVTG